MHDVPIPTSCNSSQKTVEIDTFRPVEHFRKKILNQSKPDRYIFLFFAYTGKSRYICRFLSPLYFYTKFPLYCGFLFYLTCP